MSKWEKLLRRITSLSRDMRFAELRRVLESYGYRGRPPISGSSHWTFRKRGKPPITIPANQPVKRTYVRLVKDIIESEEGKS
ncbi:MAG: toxin HicA [Bacillota bacterium]